MAGPRLSLRERFNRMKLILLIVVPSTVIVLTLVITLIAVLQIDKTTGGEMENYKYGGSSTVTLSAVKPRFVPRSPCTMMNSTAYPTASSGSLISATAPSAYPTASRYGTPSSRNSFGFVPYEKSHAATKATSHVIYDRAEPTVSTLIKREPMVVPPIDGYPMESGANVVSYSSVFLAAAFLIGANL